ncbi:chorismate-binding protein [Tellurirhabdus rosea]|uniref:chorismate-binding protein n=1 Tax=Tellurirhabdus rosea TaxID=2674997 RepID=UPI0022584C7B|nr:chorismate-binding protein [Tellurirhabdus rosea]
MNTTQSVEESLISGRTPLRSLASRWKAACSSGFSAALWRLPNQSFRELLVDTSGRVETARMDFDELPPGFAVSPFFNPDNQHTLFLNADLYWRFAEDGEIEAEIFRQSSDHPAVRRFLAEIGDGQMEPPVSFDVSPLLNGQAQEQYEKMVERAIRHISRGEMRKVVLSRTKTVDFADFPDVLTLFDRLCHAYPTAFVSAVYLPDRQQIWLGATPERLVSQDASGLFRTVALAGTQSAFDSEGQPKRTGDAQWTEKEIEEQALVCRYIISCFKKIRLREYTEEGPRTVVAGNLMHLRTDFSVNTQDVNFPQLATVMLQLLHPTSAVCGMPKETATDFILQQEGYDRELYSGYLGPVNIASTGNGPDTNLFVNLRCMKLEGKKGTLYAGAGITEDSVPAREWRETELKCQTLLGIMN